MVRKEVIIDENKSLNEYEVSILASGVVEHIFPVSITERENCYELYYDTYGFIPLKQAEKISLAKILKLYKIILSAVEDLKEHLLFPEYCLLSEDTIYTDKSLEKIRIIYVKTNSGKDTDKKDIVGEILSKAGCEDQKRTDSCLKKIYEYICENRPNFERLNSYIIELESEEKRRNSI